MFLYSQNYGTGRDGKTGQNPSTNLTHEYVESADYNYECGDEDVGDEVSGDDGVLHPSRGTLDHVSIHRLHAQTTQHNFVIIITE